MAGPLNQYDFKKFCSTPLLGVLERCAVKALPEIGLFPSVVIPGCSYRTPQVKCDADAEIFCKISEGACPVKSDFTEVENCTLGFDLKVEAPLRAEHCESEDLRRILGQSRFNWQVSDTRRLIFDRMVQQLYGGSSLDPKGFGGLADAVKYKVDALDADWNCAEDFTPTEAQEAQLTSVYLLYVAESPTLQAPGLKWIWGNGRTIHAGPEVISEVQDVEKSTLTGLNCTYQVRTQHQMGDVGFAHTCDVDVIEICNVPTFKLDGFFLENVIANAGLLFPGNRKYNRILMHELTANAMWLSKQNTNLAVGQSNIVSPSVDGSFGDRARLFSDGIRSIPMIISECMPKKALQTITATDVYTQYEQTRNVKKCS